MSDDAQRALAEARHNREVERHAFEEEKFTRAHEFDGEKFSQELKQKEKELTRSRWRDPLFVTFVVALGGL